MHGPMNIKISFQLYSAVFSMRGKKSITHWVRGWMCPKAVWTFCCKQYFLHLLGIKLLIDSIVTVRTVVSGCCCNVWLLL